MQIFLKKLYKNNNYYFEIYSDIWLGCCLTCSTNVTSVCDHMKSHDDGASRWIPWTSIAMGLLPPDSIHPDDAIRSGELVLCDMKSHAIT